MSASCQQDNIPWFENAAFQIILIVVIKINPDLSGFDEEYFVGEVYLRSTGL
jgi:hypothetical protein